LPSSSSSSSQEEYESNEVLWGNALDNTRRNCRGVDKEVECGDEGGGLCNTLLHLRSREGGLHDDSSREEDSFKSREL
jgi:hypothetical protein